MPTDYYDSEDSSDQKSSDTMDSEDINVPEEKLGLVPMTFFQDKVKPGDRETVEVVKVYDNEVAIKCIYGESKEEDQEQGGSEEEMTSASAPSSGSDELMG